MTKKQRSGLAPGAAYEYNVYRQMQQPEEDYKAERISRREYEERKKLGNRISVGPLLDL